MSRSSWKYTGYNTIDIKIFYNQFFYKQEIYEQAPNQRNNRFNFFNYTHKFNIYNGKKYLFFQTTEALYFFNLKLGAISKTRKPFFFRAKEKKR